MKLHGCFKMPQKKKQKKKCTGVQDWEIKAERRQTEGGRLTPGEKRRLLILKVREHPKQMKSLKKQS